MPPRCRPGGHRATPARHRWPSRSHSGSRHPGSPRAVRSVPCLRHAPTRPAGNSHRYRAITTNTDLNETGDDVAVRDRCDSIRDRQDVALAILEPRALVTAHGRDLRVPLDTVHLERLEDDPATLQCGDDLLHVV